MQFANYAAFRIAFLQLVEGDDFSQSTFSVGVADTMIALGESRVYRELRASTMVSPLSQAITSNAAALPADLIELKELYFSGYAPIELIPLDRLRALEAQGKSAGQLSLFAAQNGDNITFWPSATGTVLGSYYAKPEALATITWADATTFARYPEVFLYAALVESAPFLGEEADKLPVWERKYAQVLANAQHDESQRAWGGGPLRIRAR